MTFGANRRFALLLALALSVPAVSPGQSLPQKESLLFTVEWRLITAGKAQLDWNAANHAGGPGWDASLKLESTGLVSKLFKVNDVYNSRLRRDLCAISSYIDAQEGRRHRETDISFDSEAGKANYVERDRIQNTIILKKEIDVPSCVHDVVGALYKLRTLQLEPGQSTQLPISDGKKSVMARVEAQQREDVRTPAGSFRTVRYEAYLFSGVLYQRSARLHVWLSDDARKLPVQIRIRLQLTVGTITLQLQKEQQS